VQAWQPIHLRWSMTKAYFVMIASLSLDRGGKYLLLSV
jgi:hypothetical protein